MTSVGAGLLKRRIDDLGSITRAKFELQPVGDFYGFNLPILNLYD